MLTKLFPELYWIVSSRDVTELNVCGTWRCHTFGTEDRLIVKTYDYINHVVITLPLNGLRGYVDDTLPSRYYASP